MKHGHARRRYVMPELPITLVTMEKTIYMARHNHLLAASGRAWGQRDPHRAHHYKEHYKAPQLSCGTGITLIRRGDKARSRREMYT